MMTPSSDPLNDHWRAAVKARYAEPQRRYHTRRHLHYLFAALSRWLEGKEMPPALALAVYYHDAIYDPTRSDNEQQSAELCQRERSDTDAATVERAVALILSTQTHQPVDDDWDAIALRDADLWILGAASPTYDRYAALIRQEYAHVPDAAYRVGRAAVLERFLDRPRLFHGAWPYVDKRQRQARINLAHEIKRLDNASHNAG